MKNIGTTTLLILIALTCKLSDLTGIRSRRLERLVNRVIR